MLYRNVKINKYFITDTWIYKVHVLNNKERQIIKHHHHHHQQQQQQMIKNENK